MVFLTWEYNFMGGMWGWECGQISHHAVVSPQFSIWQCMLALCGGCWPIRQSSWPLQTTTEAAVFVFQLNRRKDQMKRALEQQQKELVEKRKQFDEDKRLFDEEHQKYMEELEASMRYSLEGGLCAAGSQSSLCRAAKDTNKKKKK